jgi:hypothetical protein
MISALGDQVVVLFVAVRFSAYRKYPFPCARVMQGELLANRLAKGAAQPVLTDVLTFFENRKLVISQPLRDAQVVAESSHPWDPCI